MNKLNKSEVERIAPMVLNWCIRKYGVKPHKNHINLHITYSKFTDGIEYGEYQWDTNTIVVFYNATRTLRSLITTIIHEYTHSLQNRAWYTRYDSIYEYFDNPYEIEAYAREDDWEIASRDVLRNI